MSKRAIQSKLSSMLTACFAFACAMVATAPAAERKPPLIFSPAGGVYGSNVSLTITARAGSPTIRYTLDGTEPNETSPAYSTALTVSNITLVRAKAYPRGGPSSALCAEVYTIVDEDVAAFSSNIPLLIVHSFGEHIEHETKIEGAIQSMDGGTGRTTLVGAIDFSGRALLNVRGRASLRYPKNSFTVKTITADGDPLSASILGFARESDWVLYAPYPDKTLMRDALAYELHGQMGHWAPGAKFVEVFVSRSRGKLTKRDYAGVYLLQERIRRGKDRVNIAKLKPEDDAEPNITGGYIFKKDHVDQGAGPMGGEGFGGGLPPQTTRAGFPTGPGGFPADQKGFQPTARVSRNNSSSSSSRRSNRVTTNHFGFSSTRPPADPSHDFLFAEFDSLRDEESFRTTRTNEFYFVEPEQDELTSVQKSWLKRHLNEVEAALYGPDFKDPARGYRAYLDADSFIDYHLITEITKNVDGFRFSVFYHKDRGGKIRADPIWDWNLSLGNANGKQGWIPEYWLWPQLDDREYTWYRRLFEDPDFAQRYVDRWSQLRTNLFATTQLLARIDQVAARLEEPQKRNYERWPILGRPINPNYFVGSTYEEEVSWMKKFLETRLGWIEKQFPPMPAATIQPTGKGKQAKLSSSGGEIYFTLDGTDPRARGGAISPNAVLYESPLLIEPGKKLWARSRQENRWSGPLTLGEQ